MDSDWSDSLAKVEAALLPADVQTTAYPVLIMMSGLPGSGKSRLGRRLAEELSAVVIESDSVRKVLFSPPTYSAEESATVHHACQEVMRRLLDKGVRVIFDATNLVEFQREIIYGLARHSGAGLLIVQTVAPEDVIRERLERRKGDQESPSDADWRVYRRMATRQQPIRHSYLCIDTSKDLDEAVRKVVHAARRRTRS